MTYDVRNVANSELKDWLNEVEAAGWRLVSVSVLPYLAGKVMVITHKEND